MPNATPPMAPSLPGISRCLLPLPLNPAASTHARCASVSGALPSVTVSRTIQMGTDFVLVLVGTRTAAGSEAGVFSLVDMEDRGGWAEKQKLLSPSHCAQGAGDGL